MKLKERFAKIRTRLIAIATTLFISLLNLIPKGFCSDTGDITATVMEWMPLIITFALLGMVLGLLKKFGKF